MESRPGCRCWWKDAKGPSTGPDEQSCIHTPQPTTFASKSGEQEKKN